MFYLNCVPFPRNILLMEIKKKKWKQIYTNDSHKRLSDLGSNRIELTICGCNQLYCQNTEEIW